MNPWLALYLSFGCAIVGLLSLVKAARFKAIVAQARAITDHNWMVFVAFAFVIAAWPLFVVRGWRKSVRR